MITSIRLQNFRSYNEGSFEFEPGVNIIVGPNASGKTNLLEAVMVLARGSSYRAKDAELIKFNKPWARLDGSFINQKRIAKIKHQVDADKAVKTFEIDDKPFVRLGLERTVPLVFFEPNHLQLLQRGPDTRRDYFDDILERTQPGYKSLAASYRRSLAQRNALLKQDRARAVKQLFAWNIRLSELGSQIVTARQALTDNINQDLSKIYSFIAKPKSKAKLLYASRFPVATYASQLLSKLESSAQLDFDRGFTSHGPHREDYSFELNNQPAGQTASRGETRSLILALKIFELNLIEQTRGQKPLFLLDDVFSELDGARRRALVEQLKSHQTIITTTDADAVLEYFDKQAVIILSLP